jgi:hypothetical protein
MEAMYSSEMLLPPTRLDGVRTLKTTEKYLHIAVKSEDNEGTGNQNHKYCDVSES